MSITTFLAPTSITATLAHCTSVLVFWMPPITLNAAPSWAEGTSR
ncbi:hypothetical protein ACVWZ6_006267 [Bradyrhizobium sp. GM6.1]